MGTETCSATHQQHSRTTFAAEHARAATSADALVPPWAEAAHARAHALGALGLLGPSARPEGARASVVEPASTRRTPRSGPVGPVMAASVAVHESRVCRASARTANLALAS